jgi:NitT/TauT family transport system substrate-binding protein
MNSLSSRAVVLCTLMFLGALVASRRASALEDVTLITDFGFNGRHAYFFVAIEKGYYRDVGLDVKVVRGQGSVDAIRQVGANNAIVGFADAGSLVLARGNDQIPVKLVSIVYARPPRPFSVARIQGSSNPRTSKALRLPIPRVARPSTCFRSTPRRPDSTPAR